MNIEAVFSCLFAINPNDGSLSELAYNGDITFSVSGENILINSATGSLSFENAPDYEERTTYTATVSISDGENSTSADITINVVDLNDNAPVSYTHLTLPTKA